MAERETRGIANRNRANGSASSPAGEHHGQPHAIPGYEGLQPYLDHFFGDHPDYEHNIFVVMRFCEEPHYACLFEIIQRTLAHEGLKALRVDIRSYPDG